MVTVVVDLAVVGGAAQLAGAAGHALRQGPGAQGERFCLLAVGHEAGGGVVGAEVGQVVRPQAGFGVAGEVAGVFGLAVK